MPSEEIRSFAVQWQPAKSSVDKTAAHYYIKTIAEATYLLFEWKSGDYTIRRQAPYYYVLRKATDPASG